MWTSDLTMMMLEGIRDTLLMTLMSTLFGYLFGLPMGIALAVTDKTGIKPNAVVYKVLDVVVNIVRSIPFLILLILVMPLTRAIVGKTTGSVATIVPLTLAAAPFIGRMIESSLKEVDHGVIEAAQSMGADTYTIIWKVLLVEARTSILVGVTIAIGTILGYGRCGRRRRTGRYCHAVWLLSLGDAYYDRIGSTSGTFGAGIPDAGDAAGRESG